jgi:hypothetical protein
VRGFEARLDHLERKGRAPQHRREQQGFVSEGSDAPPERGCG